MTHIEAELKNMERLVGGTIVGLMQTGPNIEQGLSSFGFRVVNNGKTYRCWIDRDPEGNGPGHLEIEEIK